MLLWLPIVGGDPAPAGRWPQLVALEGQDGDLCTGTLVAPDWVLTAGHCQNMQTAHVGALDYTANGETLAVVEQIVHPEPRATFDVSLLRLERAPTGVTPARLLTGCMAAFIQEGADLTVTGYGWLDREATQQNSILHEVVVPIVDPACTEPDRGCRTLVQPGGELVAGGDGLDSCAGDSGGPAWLTVEGQDFLAATVSRTALPYSTPCGDGGIYVRLDATIPWIRENTGLPFPDPSCEGLNLPPSAAPLALQISQGTAVELDPAIYDPDPADSHVVTVREAPLVGRVNGLVYEASPFQLGADVLELEVTDDGVPPRSTRVHVTIEVLPAGVLEEPPTGGCASAPAHGGLLDLVRRRSLTSTCGSAPAR